MSFPRYPKYKDSGVEWLGEVPEHWATTSLGRVTRDKCDGPFGSGLKSEHYVDAGVRVIRLQNIRRDGFNGSDEAFIDETYFREELDGHDVRQDDVLVAGLGDERNTVGRACVAPAGIEPAMVKADCFRFRLELQKALPAFLALQLTASSVVDAGLLSSGSTRSRIPLSVMASRKLALPPLPEQSAIAAFLDRETAKIDSLVAEQRRLIELLKEKRQAVISHAVTKGLDPHAPMKPSGIEWLGDVPVHWEIRTIAKASTKITNGYVGPTRDILVDAGTPYIQATHIKCGRVNFDNGYFVSPDWSRAHAKSILCKGDVLIVQTGAGTGDVGLVTDREIGFNCHALIIIASQRDVLCGAFLAAALQSDYGRQKLESIQTGGMHPHLNCGNVKYVEIPLPPTTEQKTIVMHIHDVAESFDALTAEAERAIDLLQERRTALISAAVTGKIDVRELAETEAA